MNKHERVLIQECRRAVDGAFKVMNWFASGECMERWGGTDPIAVLGEVYLHLAPVSQALHALDKGGTDAARDAYDRAVAEVQEKCNKRIKTMEEHHKSALEASRYAMEMTIQIAEAECEKRIADAEAGVDRRVQEGIQAWIGRHDGVRTNAGGRLVKL